MSSADERIGQEIDEAIDKCKAILLDAGADAATIVVSYRTISGNTGMMWDFVGNWYANMGMTNRVAECMSNRMEESNIENSKDE